MVAGGIRLRLFDLIPVIPQRLDAIGALICIKEALIRLRSDSRRLGRRELAGVYLLIHWHSFVTRPFRVAPRCIIRGWAYCRPCSSRSRCPRYRGQSISFPTEDGGRVCADLYGQGTRAVVLAHGGRFNKASWRAQANPLVSEGFRALAIDFRGFGCSTAPGQSDFDNAPFRMTCSLRFTI
jgi:hypothetical protein